MKKTVLSGIRLREKYLNIFPSCRPFELLNYVVNLHEGAYTWRSRDAVWETLPGEVTSVMEKMQNV